MAYGRSTRAPAKTAEDRATGMRGFKAWRRLDVDERLKLIERALTVPANHPVGGYRVAL